MRGKERQPRSQGLSSSRPQERKSTVVKRPRRFLFYLVGFYLSILSRNMVHMYKTVSKCNYRFIFLKQMSFFTLKTDQNSLRLSKIMLANGADNSAVRSF